MPDWAIWIIAGVAGFVLLKSAGGWFQVATRWLDSLQERQASSGVEIANPGVLTLAQAEAVADELGITDREQRFKLLMLTENAGTRHRISVFLDGADPLRNKT